MSGQCAGDQIPAAGWLTKASLDMKSAIAVMPWPLCGMASRAPGWPSHCQLMLGLEMFLLPSQTLGKIPTSAGPVSTFCREFESPNCCCKVTWGRDACIAGHCNLQAPPKGHALHCSHRGLGARLQQVAELPVDPAAGLAAETWLPIVCKSVLCVCMLMRLQVLQGWPRLQQVAELPVDPAAGLAAEHRGSVLKDLQLLCMNPPNPAAEQGPGVPPCSIGWVSTACLCSWLVWFRHLAKRCRAEMRCAWQAPCHRSDTPAWHARLDLLCDP